MNARLVWVRTTADHGKHMGFKCLRTEGFINLPVKEQSTINKKTFSAISCLGLQIMRNNYLILCLFTFRKVT